MVAIGDHKPETAETSGMQGLEDGAQKARISESHTSMPSTSRFQLAVTPVATTTATRDRLARTRPRLDDGWQQQPTATVRWSGEKLMGGWQPE